MEPHAHKHQTGFDPQIDDPMVRAEQRARLREFLREYQAEHGPIDPKLRAEIRAKLDTLDA